MTTTREDVERLVAVLGVRGEWMRAACLVQVMSTESDEWSDRRVRAAAEGSRGVAISGQRGYRHRDHCTHDELDHFAAALESQARKMRARAAAARRYLDRTRPASSQQPELNPSAQLVFPLR